VSDADNHSQALKLAEYLNLKVVITNDTHFAMKEQAPIHTVLTQIKAGFEYNSGSLYLKTREEMMMAATKFVSSSKADEWLSRAFMIGEKIGRVDLHANQSLPVVERAFSEIQEIVMPKAIMLGPDYVTRAKYELDIIEKMGFSTYFAILHDVVRYAKTSNVRVGPGRGSGAGSLVLYLLQITTVDPLQYDLPFERFLNPERKGMPDVDTDFDTEGRSRVLEYARTKWGAIPIATFSHYQHKQLVHDLSKHFRIPRDVDESASEKGPESAEFLELHDKNFEFGHAYDTIIGQIRHKGKHAGGSIITNTVVPIERTSGGELVVSWTEGERGELSYAGVVKYDFLGVSALSILKALEKEYGCHAAEPTTGSPVFQLFREGRLNGIFQFSGSDGIRSLTMKLEPTAFDDLVAINALYRPGALDVGATESYPEWKKTPRKVHPLIKDILEPTYGAIVYQEQVMAIYAKMTGGTLGAADDARRVIVKSKETDPTWVAKFTKLKMDFVEGCVHQGLATKEATELWTELAAHSRYSFNKAHSVSYAMIAWEMAWWKFYHPASFYAAYMNVDSTDAQSILVAAIKDGIKLSLPNINKSDGDYIAHGDTIYLPLSSIKFVSTNAVLDIVEARKRGGDFLSGEDFMKRTTKKAVRAQARKGLYMMRAFNGLKASLKDLAIEDGEVLPAGIGVSNETLLKHMGFIIPSKEDLDRIETLKDSGWKAGIIGEIVDKVSRYGPYKVFKLVPDGIFWARTAEMSLKLAIGDVVKAKCSASTGKAMKVQKI
jgi:DNA polymerase-3 subunit alpha